jgi:glycosyltransferase involved in cell wall biosynthesis
MSTLDATLKSVSAQTYSHIELIVVDCGSVDSTLDICRRYELRFLLHRGGRSEARNYGLERARGDYVLFLDSDLVIPETLVSKLVEKAEAESLDCIRLKFVHRPRRVARKAAFSLSFVRDIELENQPEPCNMKFLSRSTIDKTRFPVGIDLGEDYLFQQQIFQKNPRVGFVADPVVHLFIKEETIRNLVVRSWFYGKAFGQMIRMIGFVDASCFLTRISVGCQSSKFLRGILTSNKLETVVSAFVYLAIKYLSFVLGFASQSLSVKEAGERKRPGTRAS